MPPFSGYAKGVLPLKENLNAIQICTYNASHGQLIIEAQREETKEINGEGIYIVIRLCCRFIYIYICSYSEGVRLLLHNWL